MTKLFDQRCLCFYSQELGCDFLISATGVTPNTSMFSTSNNDTTHKGSILTCTEEGYLQVDSTLHTNIKNVFAAGDCCAYPVVPIYGTRFSSSGGGSIGPASHFFQMRLWTQVCIVMCAFFLLTHAGAFFLLSRSS